MNCLELFGNFEKMLLKMVNSRTNPTPSASFAWKYSNSPNESMCLSGKGSSILVVFQVASWVQLTVSWEQSDVSRTYLIIQCAIQAGNFCIAACAPLHVGVVHLRDEISVRKFCFCFSGIGNEFHCSTVFHF